MALQAAVAGTTAVAVTAAVAIGQGESAFVVLASLSRTGVAVTAKGWMKTRGTAGRDGSAGALPRQGLAAVNRAGVAITAGLGAALALSAQAHVGAGAGATVRTGRVFGQIYRQAISCVGRTSVQGAGIAVIALRGLAAAARTAALVQYGAQIAVITGTSRPSVQRADAGLAQPGGARRSDAAVVGGAAGHVTPGHRQVGAVSAHGRTDVCGAWIGVITAHGLGGRTMAVGAMALAGAVVAVFTRQTTGPRGNDAAARARVAQVGRARRTVITDHRHAKTDAASAAVVVGTGVVVGASGVGQGDELALALFALLNRTRIAVAAL